MADIILPSYVQIDSVDLQELINCIVELSKRGDIRTTDDNQYSVYDVISNVLGKESSREVWKRLCKEYLECVTKCDAFKFGGRGSYQPTPVATLSVIIEIIWLLPGEFSNKLRSVSSKIIGDIVQQQTVQQASFRPKLPVADESIAELIGVFKNEIGMMRAITSEYMGIRKYADNQMPGLTEYMDAVIEVNRKKLPSVDYQISASDFLNDCEVHLTRNQAKNFYVHMSQAYRQLKGVIPEKVGNVYVYWRHKDKFIFDKAVDDVCELVEAEVTPDANLWEQFSKVKLSEDERAMIGQVLRLKTIMICLDMAFSSVQQQRVLKIVNQAIKQNIVNRDGKNVIVNPIVLGIFKAEVANHG